ncbi:MAG: glycosyltransferase family 4 protein [Mucilaginibacter sp.]
MNGKKLAIITCCLDDWGGSEELWAKSVPVWQQDTVSEILLFKNKINLNHPGIAALAAQNINYYELDPAYSFLQKMGLKIKHGIDRVYDKAGIKSYQWNKPADRLFRLLKTTRPDVALISQGINFDGLVYAYQCLKLNIPYFIVSHKAVDFYWPMPGDREYMKKTLLNARRSMYVSEHNRRLTEEQFGIRMPNSMLVLNPVKNKVKPLPFPAIDDGYRLACIGRLFVIDKGQDILLRILSNPVWKTRKIKISFIGVGPDTEGLKELTQMLGVTNVDFVGYNNNLEEIWMAHHALILPSRSEGLPLTIIEAMSFGRMAITTNAGGNTEIVENGITGFIGEANETDFAITLEQAWSRRLDWETMGVAAADFIKKTIPEMPEKLFIDTIANFLKT